MNCKIQTARPWTREDKATEHSRALGHGSVDDGSVCSLCFGLAYILLIVLLIIYSVFLCMRKHKWKRGHIYSNYVTGSSLHWCELQYFA